MRVLNGLMGMPIEWITPNTPHQSKIDWKRTFSTTLHIIMIFYLLELEVFLCFYSLYLNLSYIIYDFIIVFIIYRLTLSVNGEVHDKWYAPFNLTFAYVFNGNCEGGRNNIRLILMKINSGNTYIHQPLHERNEHLDLNLEYQ